MMAHDVLNRVPSKSVPVTPYEWCFSKHSSLDHLCPWDSATYVHNPTYKHEKFVSRATKIVFIRYSKHYKGYMMYEKQANCGIMKINFCDGNFLNDEF